MTRTTWLLLWAQPKKKGKEVCYKKCILLLALKTETTGNMKYVQFVCAECLYRLFVQNVGVNDNDFVKVIKSVLGIEILTSRTVGKLGGDEIASVTNLVVNLD